MIVAFCDKYRFWIKCCGIVWGVLAATYLFYTAMYFLGNHDFRFVRYGMSLTSGVFEGRFSQFLPQYLLTMGEMLPILNIWLGLLFFSIGVTLLAKWYGFDERGSAAVCFGLLIVLNPYFLSQLYYVHSVLSICLWHLLSVCGVMLIYGGASGQLWRSFAGGVCLVLSFGGYAASIELVVVIILGKIWMEFLAGRKFNCTFCFFYLKVGLGCFAALLTYVVIISWLRERHLIDDGMYNVQTLSADEILRKLYHKWSHPFQVIWSLLPFCGQWSKYGECFLGIAGAVAACQKNKPVLSFVLVFVLVQAVFGMAYLSPYDFFYTYRIHSFSVPYLVAMLFAVAVLYGSRVVKNLTMIAAVVCLYHFGMADLEAQKVWFLGNNQDERLAERIRQDFLVKIPADKHFRMSIIGNISGRAKFAMRNAVPENLRERYREYYGFPYLMNVFFSDGFFLYETDNSIWGDGIYLGRKIFYRVNNSTVDSGNKILANIFAQSFGDDKEEMLNALWKLEPYPNRNYYFIGKKDIFLMLEKNMVDRKILADNISGVEHN